MEWSPHIIASGLYVLLFIFLMNSHPEWFDFTKKDQINITTKCFTAFFASGISAVILYYIAVLIT